MTKTICKPRLNPKLGEVYWYNDAEMDVGGAHCENKARSSCYYWCS